MRLTILGSVIWLIIARQLISEIALPCARPLMNYPKGEYLPVSVLGKYRCCALDYLRMHSELNCCPLARVENITAVHRMASNVTLSGFAARQHIRKILRYTTVR